MIRRKSLVHAVMTGKTLQTCCEVSGARKRRQYLLSAVSDSVLAGYCLIRVLWNWLGWSSILGSPYRSHCTLTITSSGDYQFQNDFSCSCLLWICCTTVLLRSMRRCAMTACRNPRYINDKRTSEEHLR